MPFSIAATAELHWAYMVIRVRFRERYPSLCLPERQCYPGFPLAGIIDSEVAPYRLRSFFFLSKRYLRLAIKHSPCGRLA